jgi:CDP-glucose 4,6-dehydratase
MAADPAHWRGRRVLLTGHTGFKGSWAATWLTAMGAEVTGLALPPETDPAMVNLVETGARSLLGDLRDPDTSIRAVSQAQPDTVLHLAAQPLVRRSYRAPVDTFAANVMGTVHLLEALLRCEMVRTILVITTDKVYENDDSGRAFPEDAPLGGHDPYAASKAATEIAVQSYARSFFTARGIKVATARGGNVIGGGDFSEDRLIPDLIRAARKGETPTLRNPQATRPWQHVLDCLDGYLSHAQALAVGNAPSALNIGPHDPTDTMTVEAVTHAMNRSLGVPGDWTMDTAEQPHEMAKLALDPTLAREALGWRGCLSSIEAIRLTADWYAAWLNGADMTRFTADQIAAYQAGEESPQ